MIDVLLGEIGLDEDEVIVLDALFLGMDHVFLSAVCAEEGMVAYHLGIVKDKQSPISGLSGDGLQTL